MEEARILGSSLEEEIIQTIPFSYTVDDRENITNPLGLYGHKLGVDLFLISVKSSYLQSIERLFNRLGYEIKHLFLSGLSTSRVVLNKDSIKNGLYIFCDIGADLTEIVVLEDAVLKHIDTMSLGGDDLTEEIAQSFKIPFELAEEIKRSLAYIVDEERPQEDKEVMIKKDGYYKPISQAKIREAMVLKTELICRSIKERLDKIVAKDKAISGIFVGGRTVLIGGFLEIMETILGVPVKMITGSQLPSVFEKRIDTVSSIPQFLNYATSLGILYEAMELSKEKEVFSPSYPKNFIAKTISRFKEIYQEYF
jgi:cell division protein FtsA